MLIFVLILTNHQLSLKTGRSSLLETCRRTIIFNLSKVLTRGENFVKDKFS